MSAGKPNENFEVTEGLALLWELTAQPDNIVFHSHEAELDHGHCTEGGDVLSGRGCL